MKEPLVSVCIPTYNGAKYLNEALASLLKQTYRNIELVISDDDSVDETLKIVHQFQKDFLFPVHIYEHKPSGIGANWNNCIENANGEYIKFLFQDDVIYPECIEELVKVAQTYPDVGVVASRRDILLEGTKDKRTEDWINIYGNLQRHLQLPEKEIYFFDRTLFKNNSFLDPPFNKVGEPSVILFPKGIVEKIGYFREDLKQILDYEFYYRVLKKYKIAIINRELAAFRIHGEQVSNINRNVDILDHHLYPRIMFQDFFWYLNSREQKKLFIKYTGLGKLYEKYLR